MSDISASETWYPRCALLWRVCGARGADAFTSQRIDPLPCAAHRPAYPWLYLGTIHGTLALCLLRDTLGTFTLTPRLPLGTIPRRH